MARRAGRNDRRGLHRGLGPKWNVEPVRRQIATEVLNRRRGRDRIEQLRESCAARRRRDHVTGRAGETVECRRVVREHGHSRHVRTNGRELSRRVAGSAQTVVVVRCDQGVHLRVAPVRVVTRRARHQLRRIAVHPRSQEVGGLLMIRAGIATGEQSITRGRIDAARVE